MQLRDIAQQRKRPVLTGLLGLVICVGVTACQTTQKDIPFKENYDPVKATDDSVRAAMEYIRVAKYEHALRHLNQALEYSKSSPEVYNGFGLAFQKTGETKLAEKNFKKAIALDGRYAVARNNYGTFLFQQGRHQQAVEQFRKASENVNYEKRFLALTNLGRSSLAVGDYEQAERSFNLSLKLNSKAVVNHLELADLYLKQGRVKEALNSIKRFDSAARMGPRGLWIGIQAADVLNDTNAKASYELALRNRFPNSPEYQKHLARELGVSEEVNRQ